MVDLEVVSEQLAGFLQTQHGAPVEIEDARDPDRRLQPRDGGLHRHHPDGSASYVLRTNPPGDAALTQSDRAQEAEILAALTDAGTVPDARSALGRPHRRGARLAVADPRLHRRARSCSPTCGRSTSASTPALALQLAETIGTVHVAGNAAVPPTLERPATWDEYIDGFIVGWRAVERAYPETQPVHPLGRRLARSAPSAAGAAHARAR